MNHPHKVGAGGEGTRTPSGPLLCRAAGPACRDAMQLERSDPFQHQHTHPEPRLLHGEKQPSTARLPPSSPGSVRSNPSSECELPCLTFLQQSLQERTMLGACAGWEGAGRWRGRWVAARYRRGRRSGADEAYLFHSSPLV